jgi:hypothetical protein
VKAAIWSRGTESLGLYVVGVVPFVSPEKNASAIWQKNGLAITSVKGSVVIAPPQVPVSAGRRLDASNKTMIVKERITTERNLAFIGPPLQLVERELETEYVSLLVSRRGRI